MRNRPLKGGAALTAYSTVDERDCGFHSTSGKRIWRGKCASDPKMIAELVRKRAPSAKRVVFETGPLSVL